MSELEDIEKDREAWKQACVDMRNKVCESNKRIINEIEKIGERFSQLKQDCAIYRQKYTDCQLELLRVEGLLEVVEASNVEWKRRCEELKTHNKNLLDANNSANTRYANVRGQLQELRMEYEKIKEMAVGEVVDEN